MDRGDTHTRPYADSDKYIAVLGLLWSFVCIDRIQVTLVMRWHTAAHFFPVSKLDDPQLQVQLPAFHGGESQLQRPPDLMIPS